MEVQKEKVFEAIANKNCGYFFETDQSNFTKIAGSPIAYWVPNQFINAIEKSKPLEAEAYSFQGIITGDNNYFLRLWHEVDNKSMKTNTHNNESGMYDNIWVPYNKGGGFRRWYGNNEYLLRWVNQGKTLTRARTENVGYYFREGVTWSFITSGTFSARYFPEGSLWDVAGSSIFATKKLSIEFVCALMNSKVAQLFFDITNPTINYQVMNIISLPYLNDERNIALSDIAKQCISISKFDWDAFETSWDFAKHPLINGERTIAAAFAKWEAKATERFDTLKANEEELNRIFIDIYGLSDELTPEVADKDITVRRADLGREIRSLISYAVGCMFGRYSLDTEGLAYAGGDWDARKYRSFIPDKDNILPICDDEYFDDDILGRFVDYVRVVYGAEKLEENLKYIADALGGNGTSREVIRNYFLNDFFKDHCKIYQKRPIYWLFDSGKKNGFKSLVYLHRYKSDLLAKLRTDYVHEQQERYRTQLSHISVALDTATGSERARLLKQQNKLSEQLKEITAFEEKVHHLADQNIEIDLDDGVKKNYEIFTDVLAKI
jgi:hypothetical protein